MKLITILTLLLSATLAHAEIDIEGSHLWLSAQPASATCDGPTEKSTVLGDAYTKCRQENFSDTTCRDAVNRAREADIFSSQTQGWIPWDNQGTYACNLFVQIFL